MKHIRPVAITQANLVSSTISETLAAWAVDTAYSTGNQVRRAKGGIQRGFQAATGSTGVDPATDDGTHWTDLGPTNVWAMFEQSVSGQSTAANAITIVADLSGFVTQLTLLNIAGLTARVQLHTAALGTYYDQTFSLVDNAGVHDWWTYFTNPIVRKRDLIVTDLPCVAAPRLTLTITATGETVACGMVLPGFAALLGGTQWGGSLGIRDFSVKQDDGFGGQEVLQRGFRKLGTFTAWIDNRLVDQVVTELADIRATPTLFIANEGYAATAIWGFIVDWKVELTMPRRSLLSLQLESLA